MKHRLIRFRRVAVSCIAGVTALTGLSVLGLAGVASATGPVTISSPQPPPTVRPGVNNQTAGTWTITIPEGLAVSGGETISVSVTDGAATPACGPFFAAVPSVSYTDQFGDTATAAITHVSPCTSASNPNEVVITLSGVGGTLTTEAATLKINSPVYDVLSGIASGPIKVTATDSLSDTFSPSGVSTADANASVIGPLTVTATAVAPVPTVPVGGTDQAAASWTITLGGTADVDGWSTGDTLALAVSDSERHNCANYPTLDTIAFAAVPTVGTPTLDTATGQTASPTFTATLAPDLANCTGATGVDDMLVLTFTNSGLITATSGTPVTFTISSVAYNLSAYVPGGAVTVTGSSSVAGTSFTTGAGASNATVSAVTLTANSPAVTAPPNAINQSISNIVITESAADQVTGTVTATLTDSGHGHTAIFDASDTPAVAATGGATVGTVSGAGTDALSFSVTSPSTSAAAFTLSALTVDTPSTPAGAVTVTVTFTPANGATSPVGPATAFTVVSPATQIYGADADATAAAELEAEFPAPNACPGSFGPGPTGGTAGSTPVVLATDQNYPDALAAAYLARYLGTGELLTPTDSLSASTLNALRLEGVSQVYIVGGSLAVSDAVATQLESTQDYFCGGTTPAVGLLGSPVDLQVIRVWGQTEYDTAADIAQFPSPTFVGSADFAGAYTGTNSSGGIGMYNDTSGTASSAPATTTVLRTAILATGEGFQDAASSSVLSYVERFPLLLTDPASLSSQTSFALQALGIQQVVLMGGPLAVLDSVVTSLQGLGITVLRVAGQDLTDTAVQLADFEVNTTTGGLGLGWTPPSSPGKVVVARGDFYTDALAGAVVAAYSGVALTAGTLPGGDHLGNPVHSAPLLLTIDPNTVGTYLPAFLGQAGSATGIDKISTYGVSSLIVLGGPLAVTLATISTLLGDL